MAYILKGQAELDLEEIWNYTFHKWGIVQAHKYIDDLNDSFKYLSQNPLCCIENLEIQPPVRIYPCHSHLVVYLINSDVQISIIRILHKKMDIRKNLE